MYVMFDQETFRMKKSSIKGVTRHWKIATGGYDDNLLANLLEALSKINFVIPMKMGISGNTDVNQLGDPRSMSGMTSAIIFKMPFSV